MRAPAVQAGAHVARWSLPRLGAEGPEPGLEEQLALFGRFVGDWSITECRYQAPDGHWRSLVGELHWRWILRGRAVQDVWSLFDPASGDLVYEGTTVRLYDPASDRWHSTWISATNRTVRSFIGRAEGRDIVLEEAVAPGAPVERWSFSGIRADSFSWRSERDLQDGRGWTLNEEMRIHRAAPAP